MMKGALDFLTGPSDEAAALRGAFVFKVCLGGAMAFFFKECLCSRCVCRV